MPADKPKKEECYALQRSVGKEMDVHCMKWWLLKLNTQAGVHLHVEDPAYPIKALIHPVQPPHNTATVDTQTKLKFASDGENYAHL